MKVGIYINGLAQSVADEDTYRYASRLTHEMNKNDDDADYSVKLEKIEYTADQKSNVINIIRKNKITSSEEVIYRFYEFLYGETLTKCYIDRNLLYKNYLLLSIVITKFPRLVWRMIKPTKQYKSTYQTVYIFSLFLIIALSILLMVPSTIALFLNDELVNTIKGLTWIYKPIHAMGIERKDIIGVSEVLVPIISFILLVLPKANVFIAGLATEFVSAHLYLQYAQQKTAILGNLDHLYEYIANKERDAEIHIHSYSFGTLIALDYLYAYKAKLTGNTLNRTKGLITIGTPYDFINTYYPNYYNFRGNEIEAMGLQWINVYSIIDALASNFRNDGQAGVADYGICNNGLMPFNIDYEVVVTSSFGFFNYITLTNLKVHGMYWSETITGKSCLDPIYMKMKELNMI